MKTWLRWMVYLAACVALWLVGHFGGSLAWAFLLGMVWPVYLALTSESDADDKGSEGGQP